MSSRDDYDGLSMSGSSDDHPDESMIAGYLDDDLEPTERTAVEAHLEQCASCRRTVADAVAVLSSHDTVLRLDRQQSPKRSTRWLVGVAALAASVVAVTLIKPTTRRSGADSVEREANAPVTEGMPVLRAYTPANGVRLTARPTLFQWASGERVDRYQFVLLSADGAPIWSVETPDTTLTLPSDVAHRLASGATYLWRVDALRGGIEATTRPRSFSIAP